MSIADKITKLQTDVTNAYNSIGTKGGTIPTNKNTENLATAILSIEGSVEAEEIEIMPSTEEQIKTGLFSEVKVAGDENLVAENIKKDVEIFGVVGTAETVNTDVKITDAKYLFYKGARTDYVDYFLALCDKVVSTEYMFYYCTSLTDLDLSNIDTSEVPNMKYMFGYCGKLTNLDVSSFDVSKVTDMERMFTNCTKLTDLDLSNFDTSEVTNMLGMFANCSSLTNLDVSSFDVSKVTDMQNMFYNCASLTDFDLSNFDTSKLRYVAGMFQSCRNLTNLRFLKNLGKGYTATTSNYYTCTVDLSSSNNLTLESLLDVINNLYDLNLTYNVANGGTLYTQKLVLGSTNLAKLTAEEIAIATNKGWNVS